MLKRLFHHSICDLDSCFSPDIPLLLSFQPPPSSIAHKCLITSTIPVFLPQHTETHCDSSRFTFKLKSRRWSDSSVGSVYRRSHRVFFSHGFCFSSMKNARSRMGNLRARDIVMPWMRLSWLQCSRDEPVSRVTQVGAHEGTEEDQ